MSYYTTQVRWIIEQAAKNQTLPITQQIDIAAPQIFNFDFPIWEESYRPILERKILMHYFNKEIGMETVGLWKLYLNTRMNEIMPYYNQLYQTAVKDYDYLTDVNVTETLHRTQNGDETADYSATENIGETGKVTINGTEDTNFQNKTNTTDNTDISSTVTSTESGTVKHEGTSGENTTHTGENHQTTGVNGNSGQRTLKSDMPQANYANLDYATDYVDMDENHSEDTQVNGQDEFTNTSSGTDNYDDKTTNTGTTTTTGSNDRTIGSTSNSDNMVTTENTTDSTRDVEKGNKSKNVVDKNEVEDYERVRKGASGRLSFQELVMKYRESLINIDMMIINELQDLFMMVY